MELTLSRTDRVLELEGLNDDGQSLIEGYDYGGKDREDVTGELVERAIDLGYLSGGETVSITVTSADTDWQAREEQEAREDLEERYGETIVIQIGPADEEPGHRGGDPGDAPEPEPTPEPLPEQTDPPVVPYDTDDRPGNGGATGYQDTDYGPDADGITDYEDTDYGPYSDGVTDYEPPNDGPYVDGDTDYEDRDDDRPTMTAGRTTMIAGKTMRTTGMMMATMTESGMTTINAKNFRRGPGFGDRPPYPPFLCQFKIFP